MSIINQYFLTYNQIITLVLLTLSFFFASSYPRRDHYVIRVVSSYLICYLSAILINLLGPYIPGPGFIGMTITYSLIIALDIFALYACHRMELSMIFIIALVAYNFRHMEYLFVQLLMTILKDTIDGFTINLYVSRYLVGGIFYLLSLPFLLYCEQYFKKNRNVTISFVKVFFILVLCVASNIIFNYFIMRYFKWINMEVKYSSYIFAIVICIMQFIMAFNLLYRERIESELAVLRQMEHERSKQYEQSKENIELINIKCHDLRHQIREIKRNIGTSPELDELEKSLRIYDTKVKTGNDALDILLSEKSLFCHKNNILFDCIIDGQRLKFIPEEEIYSLFGNILDNAIDSTMQIQEVDCRVITLKIHEAVGGVFIYQENPYVGKINMLNGLPLTDKSGEYHGYGMKSIRRTVLRYGGTLKIDTENNLFKIKIFFPPQD